MEYEKTETERGFGVITFTDSYNQKCSLQDSSNVDPHVWLGVDVDLNNKDVDARMHLTPDQVKTLLPFLTYFAETGEYIRDYKKDKEKSDPSARPLLEICGYFIKSLIEEIIALRKADPIGVMKSQRKRLDSLQEQCNIRDNLLEEIRTKYNLLPYFVGTECDCDPEVGMAPCMSCAAREIIKRIDEIVDDK
jgi:hypothetical protein